MRNKFSLIEASQVSISAGIKRTVKVRHPARSRGGNPRIGDGMDSSAEADHAAHSPRTVGEGELSADERAERILRRRRKIPRWCTIPRLAAITAVGGAVLYGIGYAFSATFAGRFGATPEDLGLGQPTLVIRAALLLVGAVGSAVVVIIILTFTIRLALLIFKLGIWLPEKITRMPIRRYGAVTISTSAAWLRALLGQGEHFWSISTTGRMRREVLGVALACAIPAAVTMEYSAGGQTSTLLELAFLTVLVLGGLRLFVHRTYAFGASMAIVSLVFLGFLAASKLGDHAASQVISTGRTDVPITYLGLMADSSEAYLPLTGPQDVLPPGLILLGRSGDVTVLTDRQRLFRVSSNGLVIATSLPPLTSK
ncbi:hypothetical protein M1D93_13195 [Arthrobacter sp. Z1-9]